MKIVILALASVLVSLAQGLDETALGLRFRADILSRHPIAQDKGAALVAQAALARLLKTPTRLRGPSLPFEVTVIEDSSVNAFTTPGGQIYVNTGMVPVIGYDVNLWSAVIGHELGHSIGQHMYKHYKREVTGQIVREMITGVVAAYKPRAAQAAYDLSGFGIGLVKLKLSRDDEIDADRIGLQLLSESGLDTGSAVELCEKLSGAIGDASKSAAFYSTHPRWETRRERLMKLRGEMSPFNTEVANSSIGPATIVHLEQVSAFREKKSNAITIATRLTVRGVGNSPVKIEALYYKDGSPIPGASSSRSIAPDSSSSVYFTVPIDALPNGKGCRALLKVRLNEGITKQSEIIPIPCR